MKQAIQTAAQIAGWLQTWLTQEMLSAIRFH